MSRTRSRFSIFLFAIVLATAAATAARVQERRADRQETARIIEALALDAGSVVADVGAGSGAWAIQLARHVTESGRVFATEVDEKDIERIRDRVSDEELTNVEVILGSQDDTGLPDACCDSILLRRVYHHFVHPQSMRESLARALRPGGRLVVIDFGPRRGMSRPSEIPESRSGHGISKELMIEEMQGAGFELTSEVPWTGRDYCLVFRMAPSTN